MRIIAHRGASAYEPENTVRAFRRAVEMGADWIELDVRLTADGHAVVLHSQDLAETTSGQGPVADLTLAEVRRLDAGLGERVPALEEVLEEFHGRCGLYVELKAPGSAEALAAALKRQRSVEDMVAASFTADLVEQAATLMPHVPASLLSGETEVDLAPLARRAGARMVHLCWEAASDRPDRLVTESLLAHYRSAGLEVVLWHEERAAVLAALLQMPVWGVCTNTPDMAVRLRVGGRVRR